MAVPPALLTRIGMAVLDGLGLGNALKRLFQLAGAVVALALATIIVLGMLIVNLPFVAADKIGDFFSAAREYSEFTRTYDDPEGITIPWDEVTAAWAALHQNDFRGADAAAIKELAAAWAERHEVEETHSDGKGNTWTEVRVWYTLRGFDETMEELNMTGEQKEQAKTYLRALKEGGLRPPAGWRASPGPGWAWPVPGHDTAAAITTGYGFRIHPITQQPEMHWGIDIAAPEGTPVLAARAGTVTEKGTDEAFGNYVVVQGGGFETLYGHLSAISVRRGELVGAGREIGRVGSTGLSTGPHLDFRVRFLGKWQNPLEYF